MRDVSIIKTLYTFNNLRIVSTNVLCFEWKRIRFMRCLKQYMQTGRTFTKIQGRFGFRFNYSFTDLMQDMNDLL